MDTDRERSFLVPDSIKIGWWKIVRSSAFVVAVALAAVIAPAIAQAQSVPPSNAAPTQFPPLRLFQQDPAPIRDWIRLQGADLWKPPATGSALPRWTIGRTVTVNGPGAFAFSAGIWVRQGDPMPLFLSQPGAMESAVPVLVQGPGAYRTQMDLTLAASVPIGAIGPVKVSAFGDVILPLKPIDRCTPAGQLLNSPAVRFGVMGRF